MQENMYERIKRLREEKGLSQDELAKGSGYKDRSSISRIEKGEKDIKQTAISNIARALGVSSAYLMDGEEPLSEYVPFFDAPLYASVSAGFGSTQEEPLGTFPCIASSDYEKRNTLCVKVRGDSMSPTIEDGDIIQVRRQSSVDSGDIAVVLLDGMEHFVKKVEYGDNSIIPQCCIYKKRQGFYTLPSFYC